MHTHTCAHMHAHTPTLMHAHSHTHAHMHTHTLTHWHTHTLTHTCVHAHTHTDTHTSMCAHAHAHTHTHTYTHTYTCARVHAHTHTHTHTLSTPSPPSTMQTCVIPDSSGRTRDHGSGALRAVVAGDTRPVVRVRHCRNGNRGHGSSLAEVTSITLPCKTESHPRHHH